MSRIVLCVRRYLSVVVALLTLLAVHRAAMAMDVPVALNQPASQAGWAENAVLLSVAKAGSDLVAVGERGFVLLSADNGRTWQQSTGVPTSVTLTKVAFADGKQGWAVGHMGVILHTADGGHTWIKQLDGVEAAKLAVAQAQQALEQATGDGAARAKRQLQDAQALVKDGPDKPFLTLVVVDPKNCLAFGAFGYAFATEDGGQSWKPLFDKTAADRSRHIYGAAQQQGTLFLVGEEGLVLRSDQGGMFEAMQSPFAGTLFGITATAQDILLAYGLQGTLLRYDPVAKQWTEVKAGIDPTLTSGLALADGRILLGSQGGQIIGSTDEGHTFALWATAPQPVTALAQAADGSLIVAGPRGISRIQLQQPSGAK